PSAGPRRPPVVSPPARTSRQSRRHHGAPSGPCPSSERLILDSLAWTPAPTSPTARPPAHSTGLAPPLKGGASGQDFESTSRSGWRHRRRPRRRPPASVQIGVAAPAGAAAVQLVALPWREPTPDAVPGVSPVGL